jgi:hypothetical protein
MSNFQEAFGGAYQTGSCEPAADYEALPPGKYTVGIEAAEVKQTKKGDGHYLELRLCVLDEQFRNRKIWDRINIQNPSQECVQIGMRSLEALCRAIGIASLADTNQLVNQMCIASVKTKDGQNEVRTYTVIETQQAATNTFVQPTQQAAARPAWTPPVQTKQALVPPTSSQAIQTPPSAMKPPWER